MNGSSVRLAGRVAAAFMFLAASACSTVIKTASHDNEKAGAAERAALRDAAADVAEAPWPKPSSSSLAERLAGAETQGEKVSRGDAVDAYLAKLTGVEAANDALMADADRHLQAARTLKDATETASDSPSPRLSDVALIEDAIADLRETRAIYLASIKKLDAEDELSDRLKDSFDDILRDLGDAADRLAENAMKKTSADFAGAEARVAGSL